MTHTPVIPPPLTPAEAVADADIDLDVDAATLNVLGLPKFLVAADVRIERRFLPDRERSPSVTVDLLTGGCLVNDVYPTLEHRDYPPEALLQPRLDEETARETAYRFVRRRTTMRFNSFSPPEITVTAAERAFKLFWILPTEGSSVTLIDSLTGDVVERDLDSIAPGESSERPSTAE